MIIKLNSKWRLRLDGRQVMVDEFKKGKENPFKKGEMGADKWVDHGKYFQHSAHVDGVKTALRYIAQQDVLTLGDCDLTEYIARLDDVTRRIDDLVTISVEAGK